MAYDCLNNLRSTRLAIFFGFVSLCAMSLLSSPAHAETSFPCDLFFDVSSDFSDGSSKVYTSYFRVDATLKYLQGIQCNVRFFCLNTSAACGCSDASQPMFSFDAPFAFSADDDLQTGIKSGDVVGIKKSFRAPCLLALVRRPFCRAQRTILPRYWPHLTQPTKLKVACVQ